MQPADEKNEDEAQGSGNKNGVFDQEEDYLGADYKTKQSTSRASTFKSERKKPMRQDSKISEGGHSKLDEKKDLKIEDIEKIRLKRNFLDTYVSIVCI